MRTTLYKDKKSAFITGMGRTFDLFGVINDYKISRNPFRDDYLALLSDYQKIIHDFKKVIRRLNARGLRKA